MKSKKYNNKELLIQFKQTPNPKELDEMLYQFEKHMNKLHRNYFMKESENPFIYFLEYSKPEELIKELKYNEEYDVVPVTCVISNMNYITSTILQKIRNKIHYQDTFNINCYLNTYLINKNKTQIETELIQRINNIVRIEQNIENPVWEIDIYIVGDITGINITSNRKNRLEYILTN